MKESALRTASFASRERDIAADLLRIEAVSLSPNQPFIWASGLYSPIYCDNRLTLGYPDVRRRIADAFVQTIHTLNLKPNLIAGTATAGIPHAAWVAERLELPMVYVRSKPKTHGQGKQIEGRFAPGDRAVVIEDLISTGGSSLGAVRALQEAGVEVLVVGAIFSYGLAVAREQFKEAQVALFALTTFETLVSVAAEQGALSPEALAQLKAWQREPLAWATKQGT